MQKAEMPVKCFCFRFWIHTKSRKIWVIGTVDNSTIEYQRPSCGGRKSLWPIGSSSVRAEVNSWYEEPLRFCTQFWSVGFWEKKILWSSIWNLMHDQWRMSQNSAFTETACDIYWHFAWPITCRNICRKFIPHTWSAKESLNECQAALTN